MATTKSPTIDGFSISNLKTMQGTDGYVIRCTLHRNGKKLGEFFDKGDGSEYYFYPAEGHTQNEVENILRRFPAIEQEDGFPAVSWNIGILVDKLIQEKDLMRLYNAAKKKGQALILVHDRVHHIDYTYNCPEAMTDDMLESAIKSSLAQKAIISFVWQRWVPC